MTASGKFKKKKSKISIRGITSLFSSKHLKLVSRKKGEMRREKRENCERIVRERSSNFTVSCFKSFLLTACTLYVVPFIKYFSFHFSLCYISENKQHFAMNYCCDCLRAFFTRNFLLIFLLEISYYFFTRNFILISVEFLTIISI